MDDFAVCTDPGGHMGIAARDWLDPDAAALLIIDVQRYGADRDYDLTRSHPFLREEGPDAYYRRVDEVALPAMQKLLAHFRDIGRPVVFLRYCSHDPEYRDMPHLWRICTRQLRDACDRPFTIHPDSEATQIMPQVAPLPGEAVMDKTTNGGFASTTLDLYLRNQGIRCLVVCGCWTNACVETTVREAADRGYLCTVAGDGCFGGGDTFHQAALRNMGQFYGQVLGTDEIIRRVPAARG
jgi:nicotinamidase-related amidase